MSHFIKNLQTSIFRTARTIQNAVVDLHSYDADQAYIEGASDIYDLEYRMREVDQRRSQLSRHGWPNGSNGIRG